MSRVSFGCAGFGLLLAPVRPCRVRVTEDDELVVAHGTEEVARITPGDVAARGAVTWFDGGRGRWGDGGPVLELGGGRRLEDVFERVDVGIGDGDEPWTVLGPGFMTELPAGVLLVSGDAGGDGGDGGEMFELHAIGGDTEDELIVFEPVGMPAERVTVVPARDQTLVQRGGFDVWSPEGVRTLPIVELAYQDPAQQPWRQLVIGVPLGERATMLVKAQAREWRVPAFFRAAQRVAVTLGPLA